MSEEKKQKMRCICAGKSAVETVDIPASAEELSRELTRRNVRKATAILWQVNEIRCGTWQQGTFSFPDEAPLNPKRRGGSGGGVCRHPRTFLGKQE